MIDLTEFNGKFCVIQFRSPDAWLSLHQEKGGKLGVFAMKDSAGNVSLVPAPFIMGTVLSMNDGKKSYNPRVEIKDENGKKLEVTINPDAILTVTVAIVEEEKKVLLIGSP